jgi:hypothetical protein
VPIGRPTGRWYIIDFTTELSIEFHTQWGLPGDIPPVNVAIRNARDRDRRFAARVDRGEPDCAAVISMPMAGADISVYRPSTGAWFNLLSQTGYTAFTATAFGTSSDTPVPGDYDGDGKSDLAVLTPSNRRVGESRSRVVVSPRINGVSTAMCRYRPTTTVTAVRTWAIFRPSNGGWYDPAVERQLHHVIGRAVGA